MKVMTLNRRATKNIGDLASGPVQYFPDFAHSVQAEILGWTHRLQAERKKWLDRVSPADLVVVGGGGLLENDKFKSSFDVLKFLNKKAVIWGAGQNHEKMSTWADIKVPYVGDYSQFSLVGIRDYGHVHEWVPCASCLSPLFDKPREIRHEFAFQANRGTPTYVNFLPAGIPDDQIIGNVFTDLETVLDLFGAAETVVTSSYHGAYWATLLGRKVVALPMSSKFYSMKYPLPLAHGSDWRRFTQLARRYTEALDECRVANRAFAEKVFNL